MLTERKQRLLRLIIEQFIQTAEPIGSKFLAENSGLGVSGATLRNEMRDLEEEGYLTHPHTSAGRIPTEQGYRYYIKEMMQPVELSKQAQSALIQEKKQYDDAARQIKAIAKFIASHGNTAVIVAFDADSIYYTGISNLFSQPEFRDFAHTMSVSSMFDQCEDRMHGLFERIPLQETHILVGQENPLGQACSAVMIRFGQSGIFTILGPMRMDYGRTVGLLEFVQTII